MIERIKNQYWRLEFMVRILFHFARGYWLYSRNQFNMPNQSFWFRYRSPKSEELLAILYFAVGPDAEEIQEMIDKWAKGKP